MNFPSTRLLITFFIALFATGSVSAQSKNNKPKLNQLGYYPEGVKLAITPDNNATKFHIRDFETGTVVFHGTLSSSVYYDHSDETVKTADFSDFNRPGKYVLYVDGSSKSYPFEIGNNVFDGLSNGLIKALYFNRASIALDAQYAGNWSRAAGHPDDNVLIHPSAATEKRPANSTISSPGGWYDAGDFNKYVVPISSSINHILFSYEQFSGYYTDRELTIPESGDNVPDVLDEALYALRWLLTMQDPDDGGVYNKLTTTNFQANVMPNVPTASRYVVQKGTAATLNFAAVMAQAARIYDPFYPDFADSALAAAELAWAWAEAHPNLSYNQGTMNNNFDPDINTGAYGDSDFSDEWFWAGAELYITTQNDDYYPDNGWNNLGVSGWGNVQALGVFSLVHHRKSLTAIGSADTAAVKSALITAFDWYINSGSNSGYRSPFGIQSWQFNWGSNGTAGNLGMGIFMAYQITGNQKYYNGALHILDYLLGRNPVGYSYVTGFGDQSPMNIHHRQSEADNVTAPVPGWVAGGPNPFNQSQDCGENAYSSNLPAASYLDDYCSYSTNEVTTYWNSPFIYLVAGLEHTTPEFTTEFTDPIRITSLFGEGFYDIGDSLTITWTTEDPTSVNVLYKQFSEDSYTELAANISSEDTSFTEFVIPNLPGDSLLFRVESSSDSDIWTESSVLKIKPGKRINVESVNAAFLFRPGSRASVTWNSAFVDTLDIFVRLSSENEFSLVAEKIPASKGFYDQIIIPDAPGDSLIVRLQDYIDDSLYSDSEPREIVSLVNNEEDPLAVKEFRLEQNYPNPFNPTTSISFTLVERSKVKLSVYNTMGQQVAILVDGVKSYGSHNVQWDASGFASGVYYYRITNGQEVFTRKMTLIK